MFRPSTAESSPLPGSERFSRLRSLTSRDNERGNRCRVRRFRTRCASLGSRCRRRRTAGRPRFGGRPAVPSSCHASTELRCERREQLAIPHQSMSSLSASVSSVLPAGESTRRHVAGRRTCCRAQRGRTAGAAARIMSMNTFESRDHC